MKKKLLFLTLCAFSASSVFAQNLVVNGGFELPDDGVKYLNINQITGWHSADTIDNQNGRESSTAMQGKYREYSNNIAKPIYQSVDLISNKAGDIYNLSYMAGLSWNPTAADTVYSVVYISHYNSDSNINTRVIIDSVYNRIDTLTAPRSFTYSFSNPVAYAGDNLVLEFKTLVWNDTLNTNTWTSLDAIVLNKFTTFNMSVVNPGFELPDDGVKYTDINQIPGWHSDDLTDNKNGRETSTNMAGKYREYSNNITKPIYQTIDIVSTDSAQYNVSYLAAVAWNPTASDTVYSVVYLSHYSSDMTSRTVIDSFLNRIDTLTAARLMTASFKIPAGVGYAGDKLAIEFKTAVWNDTLNTNTWTNLDSIAIQKIGDSIAYPTIPFDVVTFAGDIPEDASIVVIGGKKYLKVRENGWNTTLKIAPIKSYTNTSLSFSYKYEKDTSTYAGAVLAFVQFFTTTNVTKAITDNPASTTIKSLSSTMIAGTFDRLQLAIQAEAGTWPAIAGPFIYISQMAFDSRFDMKTFAGEIPAGGSIVTISTVKYLKVRLDGWNTAFDIQPIITKAIDTMEFSYKIAMDTSTFTGTALAFVQFFNPLKSNNIIITDNPYSTTIKTIVSKIKLDTLNNLQLALQSETGTWPAIAGPFIFISQVTVYGTPVPPIEVKSLTQNNSLVVYPSPASNYVNIISKSVIKTVQITDITGKTLYYGSNYNDATVRLNISDLHSGIYFVRVNNSDVQRIVKQ